MREKDFIARNKDKWEALEDLLEEKQADPAELGELFVKVSDDLSYAQTFYRHRSVRVYLNSLARKIFDALYKRRKMRRDGFLRFWAEDLPLMVYEARAAMRLSFWFFVFTFLIGVFSSIYDPDFARYILGDSYVAMTEENIASGDPLAVYQERDAFGMTAGIALNNLWVDLLIFFSGIFAGIGSLAVLLSNGIMVGTFQYFFIERGLFWQSFLTIWLHGTLEMAGAVISGAAGLTMGLGLLFPGTLSRMQSFRLSARRGIQIMMGVVPLTLIAAFVEGFFSRYTHAPWFLRLFFILLCLGFVIWYYVYLPVKLGRSKEPEVPEFNRLKDFSMPIQYTELRSGGTLFVDSFAFFRKHASGIWRNIFTWTVLGPAFFIGVNVVVLWYSGESLSATSILDNGMDRVGGYDYSWPTLALQTLALAFLAIPLTKYLYADVKKYLPFGKFTGRFSAGQFIGLLALTGGGVFFIYWMEDFSDLFMVFPLLFFSLVAFVMVFEKNDVLTALFKALGLVFGGGGFGPFLLLSLSLGLIGLFLFLLTNTLLSSLLLHFVTMNFFVPDSDLAMNVSWWIDAILANVVFYFFFSLVYVAAGQLYVALHEKRTASHLLSRIAEIGRKTRIRGIEREQDRLDF